MLAAHLTVGVEALDRDVVEISGSDRAERTGGSAGDRQGAGCPSPSARDRRRRSETARRADRTHTIVEIVNDDMPFLVDSVTTCPGEIPVRERRP